MEQLVGEAALPRGIDAYCSPDSSDDARVQGLNSVILQLHRGNVSTVNDLVAGHLRPYLTNADAYVRMRGTKLVAECLKRLPDMKLDEKVMGALVKFFVERFKLDYDSATPCLAALSALLELHETVFPISTIRTVTCGVLKDHHVPAMTQSLRIAVYNLVTILVNRDRYLKALQDQFDGLELVELFSNAMEGEKDPRCLLVCLRVASVLVSKDNLKFRSDSDEQVAVERIFDVTCVYFPIVFKPPPNDPFNIKASDLWNALYGVFKCNPLMGDQVLPMLLDKLNLVSADAAMAKADSLRTLKFCVPSYGCSMLSSYLEPLKGVLHRNIVNADQAQVAEESLQVLRVVVEMLSREEDLLQTVKKDSGRSENWNDFVEVIVEESTESVKDSIDSMVGRASGRLLCVVARASAFGFSSVLKKLLVVIHGWCDREDLSMTQRNATFELLRGLIHAIDPDIDFQKDQNPMTPEYVSIIFGLLFTELESCDPQLATKRRCVEGVKEAFGEGMISSARTGNDRPRTVSSVVNSSKPLAIAGLEDLIVRPPSTLLNMNQVEKVIKCWSELLASVSLDDEDAELIEGACLKSLVKTGKAKEMCADLISTITVPAVKRSGKLDALADLCAIPKVFDSVMPHMLDNVKFEHLHKKLVPTIAKIIESNRNYEKGLEGCCLPLVPSDSFQDPVLLSKILHALKRKDLADNRVIDIVRALCQCVSVETQATLIRFAFTSMLEESKDHNDVLEYTMPAITAIAGSVRPEVASRDDLFVVHDIVQTLLGTAGDTRTSETVGESASKCIASLFNKMDLAAYETLVAQTVANLLALCGDASNPMRVKNLKTLSWISKGLAMRSHPASIKISDQVILYFLQDEDKDFSVCAANYFGLVLKTSREVLNRSCHSRQNLFFQQRFFGQNFGKIMEKLEAVKDSGRKKVLLLAAVRLVEFVPKAVLLQEVEPVLRLLTQALSSAQDDYEVQTSALVSLHIIVENNIEATEPYLLMIIPLLLEMTKYTPGLSARHRALAIDCVFAFASFPYNKIHSVRNLVNRKLCHALDDPKRPVRKRAVKCRNRWLILNV
uniref:MMS19 nucleotide excision repair protein n=1 Tax=Mucochytrium quahogii TaxID=96639 RepID=A0A7S2W8N8_9STRA|mmetsp:Transcript_13516/g.22068  ORF Transcript_13516/g.22068 Transcript_13516/m.22068 type:complete len:1068 (+) Transcript_13516:15-3218(+)